MLFNCGRWLVCHPLYFDVSYEINPWMNRQIRPESSRAYHQWQNLHHHLIRLGGWVEYIQPAPKLPDMVFTANGGLVRNNRCVISKFRHPERQGESRYFKEWFEASGFQVIEPTSGSFEGEGDALFAGDRLFAGYGFRSDKHVYDEVVEFLGVKEVVLVELNDPRFYHLDTCFCPISPTQALYYPPAFSQETIEKLKGVITLYPVPEGEGERFACNIIVLGQNLIIPAGCDETCKLIRNIGFKAYPVEMDEFLKGGGAAKCVANRIG